MASGKTNAAIGRQLFLSESAVEKYSSSIFSKLQLTEERELHRRVAAVLAYLESTHRAAPSGS
jgi:DNA-binding NarL/FixJ family response regulator